MSLSPPGAAPGSLPSRSAADLAVLARLQEARQPLGLPDPSIPSPELLIRDSQFTRRAVLPPPPSAWRWLGVAWATSAALRLVLLVGAVLLLVRSSGASLVSLSASTELGVPPSPVPQLRLAAVTLGVGALVGVSAALAALLSTRTPLLRPEALQRLRQVWTPARLLRVNLLTLTVLAFAGLAASGVEDAGEYGLPSELRELVARGAAAALLVGTGVELLAFAGAAGVRVLRAAAPRPEFTLPRGQRLFARSGALVSAGLCLVLVSTLAGGLYSSVGSSPALPAAPEVSDPFARASEELRATAHIWELRTGTVLRADLDELGTASSAPSSPAPSSSAPSSSQPSATAPSEAVESQGPAPAATSAPAPYGAAALVAPSRLRLLQRFTMEEGGGRVQEFVASRGELPGALTPRILSETGNVPGFDVPLRDPVGFLGAAVGRLERTAAIAPVRSRGGRALVAPEGCEVYEGTLQSDRLEVLELRRLAGSERYSPATPAEPRWAAELASVAVAQVPPVSIRICLDPSGFPVLVERRQSEGARVRVTQLRPVRDSTFPVLVSGGFPPLPPELGTLTEPPSRLGETLGRIFTE